jgi:hypothetical protein
MNQNKIKKNVVPKVIVSRRSLLVVMFMGFFSITVNGEGEDINENLDDKKLKELLKKLALPEFAKKNKKFDQTVVSRIKDGFRNQVSDDDIGLLCILAAANEWDFLLLIWTVAENSIVRLMVLLLHLSIRDKDSLGFYFDFSTHAKKFTDSRTRISEIEYIKTNQTELTKLLSIIANNFDNGWSKTISSLKNN